MRSDGFPHGRGDRLGVGGTGDDDPTPLRGEVAVGAADRGMELGSRALEPVARLGQALQRDGVGDVEHHDDIGLHALRREPVDRLDRVDTETARDALVHERRRREPVAHDDGAARERRRDELG